MNIIVSNKNYLDNDFTVVCSSIEELYKALVEAKATLSDDHIYIEFCNEDSIGNNMSANYEAIIWNKDVTRY